MAQNLPKNHKKKPSNPIVLSHSRSISTIPGHQNNISFMPKFLLKLLHNKKKQGHKRSISIVKPDSNSKDAGVGKTESIDKISMIDKHMHRKKSDNNYLLQLLPVPKKVSRILSSFSRNTHKSHHHHKTTKSIKPGCSSSSVPGLYTKGKSRKNQLPCKSSDFDQVCDCGAGNGSDDSRTVSAGQGRIIRVKSGKMKPIKEKKGGLRIKGFMKIKRKEKQETRFELCKKKILMGEKCWPLNGTLCYDQNGVLVTQHLPD